MGSASVVALVVVVLKGWVGGNAEDCGAGGVEDVGVVDDMVWYCFGVFIDYLCSGFEGRFFIEEELEGCCCLDVVLWYARALETCTGDVHWSSANDKIPSRGSCKRLFVHTNQLVYPSILLYAFESSLSSSRNRDGHGDPRVRMMWPCGPRSIILRQCTVMHLLTNS